MSNQQVCEIGEGRALKSAFLAKYGHFADRRIRNINRASRFIVDDREQGGRASDGQPSGWFCEVIADVLSDNKVRVTLQGQIPQGSGVHAWMTKYNTKISRPFRKDQMIFEVGQGDARKLGELEVQRLLERYQALDERPESSSEDFMESYQEYKRIDTDYRKDKTNKALRAKLDEAAAKATRISDRDHIAHEERHKAWEEWDAANFLARLEVSSINKAKAEGKTLALLRPRNLEFFIEKKSAEALQEEKAKFQALAAQSDLFNSKPLFPYEPSPYAFKYSYTTDDGDREGTCQDWETDATFYNWNRQYGERKALEEMQRVFGEEYPKKGMVLAMGTHSLYPDVWLINGIIRLDEIMQMSLL